MTTAHSVVQSSLTAPVLLAGASRPASADIRPAHKGCCSGWSGGVSQAGHASQLIADGAHACAEHLDNPSAYSPGQQACISRHQKWPQGQSGGSVRRRAAAQEDPVCQGKLAQKPLRVGPGPVHATGPASPGTWTQSSALNLFCHQVSAFCPCVWCCAACTLQSGCTTLGLEVAKTSDLFCFQHDPSAPPPPPSSLM